MIAKGKKRILITLSIEQIAKLKDFKECKNSYFYKETFSEIIGKLIDGEFHLYD